MSSQPQSQSPPTSSFTSLTRVSHIPIVECGLSRLHDAISASSLLSTPYNISLSISNRLSPIVQSASTHYPFAPFLVYGDRAANKGLDLAQQTWPYPFESKPEKVWNDVRSVADERVIQPAFRTAKSVDQSLTPLVNSFSFVVKKIDADAENKARATDEYQIQRAYALLRVLADDIIRTPNEDQNALVKNIHATLTRFTQQSSAFLSAARSRSEGAAQRAHELAQAILAELDKLSPLVSSLTHNTSSTLKDTATTLRSILASNDAVGQKIPKIGAAVQGGVKDVVEDIVEKVHTIVEDIRSSSSSSSSSAPSSPSPSSPSSNKPLRRAKKMPKKNQEPPFHNENISVGGAGLN